MTQQITHSRKNRPNKYHNNYGSQKLYAFFSRTHGGKRKHGIDKSTYFKILTEVTDFIREEMIMGRLFYLPFGLGTLYVRESYSVPTLDRDGNLRKELLRVDWASTLKWWRTTPNLKEKKVLYHNNKHTNGNGYSIMWDKTTIKVKGCSHYSFQACRRLSRGLAAQLKDPDYERNYSKI